MASKEMEAAIDAEMSRQQNAINRMRSFVSRVDPNRSYRSQKRIPVTAVASVANKDRFGSKY